MYAEQVIQTALHGLSPNALYTYQDVERIIKNALLNVNDVTFTRKEAAKYIKFAPSTLATWDSRKTYDLEPISAGKRKVLYKKSVLDRFLEERQMIKSQRA